MTLSADCQIGPSQPSFHKGSLLPGAHKLQAQQDVPRRGCGVRATHGGPHSANNPVLPQWGRAGKGCGHPGKGSRHMVLPRGAVRGNDRSERGRPQGAWGLWEPHPAREGAKHLQTWAGLWRGEWLVLQEIPWGSRLESSAPGKRSTPHWLT